MGNAADTLQLLQTFTRIAESGSLSAAARSLGTTQASVSRQLAALEGRLGTALARRSTHDLSLTDEGERLLPRAMEMLAAWQATREALGQAVAEPSGLLRIIAPSGIGPTIVARTAAAFARSHPKVDVDLVFTDASVDLVGIGADLQLKVGPVDRQELLARRIGAVERWLVAAGDLDLGDHCNAAGDLRDGLPLVALAPLYGSRLQMTAADGSTQHLTCRIRLRCEVLNAAYQAVLAGAGAGLLPRWLVGDDVAAGRLKRLAPAASFASVPIHLVFPPGRYRPLRTRLFAEQVEAAISALR